MTKEKKCSKCKGTGRILCPACTSKESRSINEKKEYYREIPKIVNCSHCHGTGTTVCGACNGRG
jgi:RecJ-like exonuclease